MPRISDKEIINRVRTAMAPPMPVPSNGQRQLAPQTLQSLIEKAKAKRGAMAGATTPQKAQSPEDMKRDILDEVERRIGQRNETPKSKRVRKQVERDKEGRIASILEEEE